MTTINPTVAMKTAAVKKARPAKTSEEELRETIEAIVIAFILAFLFRTFAAEAFIIPTGSMAPTLYGRHKDMVCPGCGFSYDVGASNEVDESGYLKEGYKIDATICPNCRFQNFKAPERMPFKGDRILVNKAAYNYVAPQRYDVIVFKFPEDPKTNYIKRLVGLPGETLQIRRGNLYLKTPTGFEILRKPYEKQAILEMPVYDDRFEESSLLAKNWPSRWGGMIPGEASEEISGWKDQPDTWKKTHEESKTEYQQTAEQSKTAAGNWLRYRHYFPQVEDWDALNGGRELEPKPQLISDFCGYNTDVQRRIHYSYDEAAKGDSFWVNDLSVDFELVLTDTEKNSQMLIEMSRGVHHFVAEIDVSTGKLTLKHINDEHSKDDVEIMGTFDTPIRGAGTYQVKMANIDDRISLWVNAQLVDMKHAGEYSMVETDNFQPLPSDFSPVGICIKNSAAVVRNLMLKRDVYYQGRHEDSGTSNAYVTYTQELNSMLSEPANWHAYYKRSSELYDSMTLNIGPADYFVLGDNSPRSQDGRLWSETQTVPANALVGKAFFVYWPHGIPFLGKNDQGYPLYYHQYLQRDSNGNTIVKKDETYPSFTVPFYPDFHRMGWIR